VRQEKCALASLQEFYSLHMIQSLHVDEVLNDDDSVLQIEPRGFLNPKLPYDVLQSFQKDFVHAPLVTSQGNLREEVVRSFREVERELVRHGTQVMRGDA